MIGLVTLFAALLEVPSALANPSVVAQCTGDGWTITVGLNPGTEGTDLLEVASDDGRGHATAWEATITSGKLAHVLRTGVVVNDKTRQGDQATVKMKRDAGTWTLAGASHALTCAYN